MKKLFTISMLVFCCGTIYAQPNNQRMSVQHDPVFKYAQQIVNSKKQNIAAKTTGVKQRVIAQSGYDIFGGIISLSDSFQFEYSGANGSRFDYNDLTYNPYFSPGATANMYTYGDILVKADTVKHVVDPTLSPYEMIVNSFTSAALLKDHRYKNYPDVNKSGRSLVDYDAFGKPAMVLLFSWNPSLSRWDTAGKIAFAYNGINQLESDTSYEYNSGIFSVRSIGSYVYDWGGNLVSKLLKQDFGWGLTDFARHTLTYYPNQTIKELLVESSVNSVFRPDFKFEVIHDPANLFITQETASRYDSQNQIWDPFYKIIRSTDLQGLPDTSRFYNWFANDWSLYEMTITSYNSEANPERVTYYRTGPTGLEVNYQHKFYYELYNVLGIDEGNEKGNTMHVYPNPASDFVNVQLTAQSNEVKSILLMNSTGQIVRSIYCNRQQSSEYFNLSGLNSGIYFLCVTGKDGAILHKQSLVKQ